MLAMRKPVLAITGYRAWVWSVYVNVHSGTVGVVCKDLVTAPVLALLWETANGRRGSLLNYPRVLVLGIVYELQ